MDLSDYLRILRQRWPVLATCVVIGLIAAWISTPAAGGGSNSGQEYTATATLLSTTANQDQRAQELSLAKKLTTTGKVGREAAKRIPSAGDPTELAAALTVETAPDAGVLTVSVQDVSAQRAAAVSNGFAEALVTVVADAANVPLQSQLNRARSQLKAARAQLATLEGQQGDISSGAAPPAGRAAVVARVAELNQEVDRLEGSAETDPLLLWERAVGVPVASSGGGFRAPSNLAQRLLIGLVLGLLLGAALALLLDRIDTRLRTRAAAQKAFGLPVVGEIPRLPKRALRGHMIIAAQRPETAVAESYRALRSAVLHLPTTTLSAGPLWPSPELATTTADYWPHRVVLVTSPRPGDGRTTTVVNLAACIAETGKSVLVLDCDLRNPGVHQYLEPALAEGLSDLLVAKADQDLREIVQPTSITGVRVATAGTEVHHPAALLSRMGDIIRSAGMLADVVLIDAPPLLTANDAIELIPNVDTVLVVSRSGTTTVDNAERTNDALARVQAPVTGVALIAAGGPFAGDREARSERGWRRVAAVLAGNDDTGRSTAPDLPAAQPPEHDATIVFGRIRTPVEQEPHGPWVTPAGRALHQPHSGEASASADADDASGLWPIDRHDDGRTP